MRSRYDLAQNATVKGEDGTYYKDIFTIPTHRFRVTESSEKYALNKADIERPDIMMFRKYRLTELDDIVLWVNNIGLIYELEPGTEIELPASTDLENFYYSNRE